MLDRGPESNYTQDMSESGSDETSVPLEPTEQLRQESSQEAMRMAEAVASGDVRKLADAVAGLSGIESNGVLLTGEEIATQMRIVADNETNNPEIAYQALLKIPNGEFGLREKVAQFTSIKDKYLKRLRDDLSLE